MCREVLLYSRLREAVALNCDPPAPDVKARDRNLLNRVKPKLKEVCEVRK